MIEKKPADRSLILVYNADSGFFNALADSAHKLLSPSTYDCRLCALTYGAVQIKKEWARFLRELGIPVRFLHRDEFRVQFPESKINLPTVLIQSGNSVATLIESDEIKRCRSLNELEELLQSRAYRATGYT